MDYTTAQELFDALSGPFPSEAIDWRLGSTNGEKTKGMALAYIDARAVMDRLDCMCGPDGWQCSYSTVNTTAVCNLGIRMPNGEWLWKSDGAGQTDVEAEKGALSDALKRAGVRWGIGRYLYDLSSPWVEIEAAGRSYRIKAEERKKLDAVHDEAIKRMGWGNPTEVAAYRFLHHVVQQTVTQPAEAMEFREKFKGMMPLLRVAMRKHLEQTLDRIGGPQSEAAE
jgi:hypothetical protein